MRANLDASGGLVFSQRVLLALTGAGHGARGRLPQSCRRRAMRGAAEGGAPFRDALAADPRVRARPGPRGARRAASTWSHYLRSVDALFARAAEPPWRRP